MMFSSFFTMLFQLIFPKAPDWVAPTLWGIVELATELIDALEEAEFLTGAEKFEFVLEEVKDDLEEALEEIPGWRDWSEKGRERILDGLLELTIFIRRHVQISGKKKTKRQLKKALKKLKLRET